MYCSVVSQTSVSSNDANTICVFYSAIHELFVIFTSRSVCLTLTAHLIEKLLSFVLFFASFVRYTFRVFYMPTVFTMDKDLFGVHAHKIRKSAAVVDA